MAARTQVYRITTAQVGLTADQDSRTKRYLISMTIRTLCFIGAVVTDGWLRWTLVAGAIALPYLAVVVANGGREPNKDSELSTSLYVQPQYQPELPSRSVDHSQ
jgi:bacteriorhodopsin